MEKIAVLISTYNGEKYIREQMNSIISQDIEVKVDLYIRDDESKDSTTKILESYSYNNQIKVIYGKNIGVWKSFLSLLKEVKNYDYYAFSDQDDVWNLDKLQRGLNRIKNYECPALYYSNSKLVNEDLSEIGRNVHRTIPSTSIESFFCIATSAQGCTCIFNRKLAEIIQKEELPSKLIMHDSFITCLCKCIGGKLIYDHIPSMMYRMTQSNTLGLATRKQYGAIRIIVKRIADIFTKNKVSMSDQAYEIKRIYGKYIDKKYLGLIDDVIACKKSFIKRFKIINKKELRCDSLNMTIMLKLKIILGNN